MISNLITITTNYFLFLKLVSISCFLVVTLNFYFILFFTDKQNCRKNETLLVNKHHFNFFNIIRSPHIDVITTKKVLNIN